MIGKDICLKIQGNSRVFLSPQDEGPTFDGTERNLNRAYFYAFFIVILSFLFAFALDVTLPWQP